MKCGYYSIRCYSFCHWFSGYRTYKYKTFFYRCLFHRRVLCFTFISQVDSPEQSCYGLMSDALNMSQNTLPRFERNPHFLGYNISTQLIFSSVQFIIFILADDLTSQNSSIFQRSNYLTSQYLSCLRQ